MPGAAEVDALVEEMLAEHRYRSRYGGLTHEEYQEEPAVVVDWLNHVAGVIGSVARPTIVVPGMGRTR